MASTIKEIAQALGLSPSTVSRALSDHPQIAADTKLRVQRMAEKLHYAPNLWAQNLVGASTNVIGCLVLAHSNPFYIPMVRGVEDFADAHDYIVFIGESRHNYEIEKRVIDRFRRIRTAGVIVSPASLHTDHLFALEKDGVAVIAAGRTVKGLDTINIDNTASGAMVGEFFARRNCKHVAFVSSGRDSNLPELERMQGLNRALNANGIGLAEVYRVGDNRISAGEKAGTLYMRDEKRPDAVFCSNDLLAMGFIQSVMRDGIQVPDDVIVVGHDDIPFADNFILPLTTIAFPKYEMGKMAAELLLRRIKKPSKNHQPAAIILQPRLIERNSSRLEEQD